MQRFASEKIPKIITKVLIVFLKTCIADRKGTIGEEGERLRDSVVESQLVNNNANSRCDVIVIKNSLSATAAIPQKLSTARCNI